MTFRPLAHPVNKPITWNLPYLPLIRTSDLYLNMHGMSNCMLQIELEPHLNNSANFIPAEPTASARKSDGRDVLKKEIADQKAKLQNSRDVLQAKSDSDAKAGCP